MYINPSKLFTKLLRKYASPAFLLTRDRTRRFGVTVSSDAPECHDICESRCDTPVRDVTLWNVVVRSLIVIAVFCGAYRRTVFVWNGLGAVDVTAVQFVCALTPWWCQYTGTAIHLKKVLPHYIISNSAEAMKISATWQFRDNLRKLKYEISITFSEGITSSESERAWAKSLKWANEMCRRGTWTEQLRTNLAITSSFGFSGRAQKSVCVFLAIRKERTDYMWLRFTDPQAAKISRTCLP